MKANSNLHAEQLKHQIRMKSVYMSMRIYQEYRKRLKRFGEWDYGQFNDIASYKKRKTEIKKAPTGIPIEEWT